MPRRSPARFIGLLPIVACSLPMGTGQGWMRPGQGGATLCGDDPHRLLAKGGFSCQQLSSLYQSLTWSLHDNGCDSDMAQMGWPVPLGTTRANVCPSQCPRQHPECAEAPRPGHPGGEIATNCHANAYYDSVLQAAGFSCADVAATPSGIEFGCSQDMSDEWSFPVGTTKADICPQLCGCPSLPCPDCGESDEPHRGHCSSRDVGSAAAAELGQAPVCVCNVGFSGENCLDASDKPNPAGASHGDHHPPPPAPPHGETWANNDCMQDEPGWTESAAGLTCAQIGQQHHTCAGQNAYWTEIRHRCPFSCGLCITASGATFRRPEATLNPTGNCGPLWRGSEMPRVYELDLHLPEADFADLVENQARSYDASITKDTTVVFNGTPLAEAKLEVHGNKYERGGGHWDGTVHGNENNQHTGPSAEGQDCYLRDDASATYNCKPSFRLQFSDAAPLRVALEDGFLFRYPAGKQRCNTSPKFLNLRGEFNDPVMLRNKLTMDLIKSAGGVAPRIEYGR